MFLDSRVIWNGSYYVHIPKIIADTMRLSPESQIKLGMQDIDGENCLIIKLPKEEESE